MQRNRGLISIEHRKIHENYILVAAGDGFPVAILDHDKPAFYCIPAKAYEMLMDKLDDVELAAIVESRKSQPSSQVGYASRTIQL